jgi:hypothetical protein
LTIQQKVILYAKSTPGCKQLNFMGVIVTPERMLLSYRCLTSKIRMNREKNGGHFVLFYLVNRPRNQFFYTVKNTVTNVTVQNS